MVCRMTLPLNLGVCCSAFCTERSVIASNCWKLHCASHQEVFTSNRRSVRDQLILATGLCVVADSRTVPFFHLFIGTRNRRCLWQQRNTCRARWRALRAAGMSESAEFPATPVPHSFGRLLHALSDHAVHWLVRVRSRVSRYR